MAIPRRAPGVALAVVALALTVTGIVIAATDTVGPSAKDPLALNGYPPTSARLLVVLSAGGHHISANVDVNFATNAVQADVNLPLLFSTTTLELRLVGGHLYATVPSLASVLGSTWVSVSESAPPLFGLSLEMTKPDVNLVSGYSSLTTTHSGYKTTYTYHYARVHIGALGNLPISLPKGAINFSVTVGKQGELTGASLTAKSKGDHVSIAVTVLSYNKPAVIVAPPRGEVKPVGSGFLNKLLGPSIGRLVTPTTVPLGSVIS